MYVHSVYMYSDSPNYLHSYTLSICSIYFSRFQLVDFGLAHAVQTKEELLIKPSSRPPRGRTAIRGESSSTTTTTISKLRGIAPPSTFSRQLHHRAAARGHRTTTSKGKMPPSKGKSKQTESGQIRLCPIRHKLSEVCDICMARWVWLTVILIVRYLLTSICNILN